MGSGAREARGAPSTHRHRPGTPGASLPSLIITDVDVLFGCLAVFWLVVGRCSLCSLCSLCSGGVTASGVYPYTRSCESYIWPIVLVSLHP